MPDMTTLGAAGWISHTGPDNAAARDFYSTVIGWNIADLPMQEGPSMPGIMVGDGPIGAFAPMKEDQGSWTIYITVKDVDDCVAKAKNAGAEIMSGPMDMPGVGRMATLQDPQGARFAVITYESMQN